MINSEAKAVRERNGAMTSSVLEILAEMYDDDTVHVVVVMKHPEFKYPVRGSVTMEKAREVSLYANTLRVSQSATSMITETGVQAVRTESCTEASVSGVFTKSAILKMAYHPSVVSIAVQRPVKECATRYFHELANSAYNPPPMPSYWKGSGVQAATIELGLTQAYINCKGGLISSQLDIRSNPGTHTLQTFQCLLNTAPSASLWHKRYFSYGHTVDDNPFIQWAATNSIETISMSMPRGGQTAFDCDHPEFIVMDDMAYRFPYPTFCNPTANDGYQYIANWHCYNAINVGNVQHEALSGYVCRDEPELQQSQTANPNPKYGSVADRELPMVVAPGVHPDNILADSWWDNCLGTFTGGGTSYSAPIANGIAACVISARPTVLKYYPESVRAIILATAQNVHGTEWNCNIDGRDGAGVVSGIAAASFAASCSYVSPNNSPVEHGLSWGAWYQNDYANRVYAIKIPQYPPQGRHLRIVFTWNSNPDIYLTFTNSLSDLDLVFSATTSVNGAIQWSTSYNSNVEIVDIPQSSVTPGATYYALLTPFVLRIPAGARTNHTYFAVAWTWVEDHAQ